VGAGYAQGRLHSTRTTEHITHRNSAALNEKGRWIFNNCGVMSTLIIHWLGSPLFFPWCSEATLAIWSARLAKGPYYKNTPPAMKLEPVILRGWIAPLAKSLDLQSKDRTLILWYKSLGQKRYAKLVENVSACGCHPKPEGSLFTTSLMPKLLWK